MRGKKVGYQGEPGAFSTLAAGILAEGAELIPCKSFRVLFERLDTGEVEYGIVPIENSLASSVVENYDLLSQTRLPIFRECTICIVHNLIALPGVKLSDVRYVYSHPVAIRQCVKFLYDNRDAIEAIPGEDTAGSVKKIIEEEIINAAAIASAECAEIYGGNILVRNIGDHSQKYTRFFLVGSVMHRDDPAPPDANKIFVIVSFRDVPGALARFLAVFASRGFNLSDIEKRPIPGRPFEYLFFFEFEAVDGVGDLSIPPILAQMQNTLTSFVLLGPFATR